MSGELDNLALALASAGVQHTYVKSKPEDMAELSQALASAGLKHMLVGGASEVVAADSEKRIRISYETWDEDALDAGETDDKGWENEEGVDFTDDGDETAVDQAVDFLKKEGATEFSSSAYDPRGYYSTESGSDAMDPQTGETTVYSYHLTDGWTDEEKKAIYDGVIKGASSNEAEASTETVITAAGYTHLDDRIVSKIESGLPFKINNGSVNGSPRYSGSGWARDKAKEVIQKLQDAGADYWIYSYGTPILARLNEQWYDIPGKYSPTTTRHQGGLSRQFNATTFDETVTNPDVRRPVAPGGLDLEAEASVNLSALSSVLATAGVKHTVVTAFEPSAPIDVVITSGTVKKQLTIKPNRYAAEYNVGQLAGAIESWSKKYMGPAEAVAATTEEDREPFFITIDHGEKEVTFKYIQSPYDPAPTTILRFVEALHTVGGKYKGTQFELIPPSDEISSRGDKDSFFIAIKHGSARKLFKYSQSPYDPAPKTIRNFVQALYTVGGRYKGTQLVEVPRNEATASTEVVAFGATRLQESARAKIERGLPFKINNGSVSGSPTFRGAGWAENNHDSMQAIEKLEGMNADYWLYSYATPIGARVGDQWYIIPGKYTRTTTNHQHILSDLGAKPLGDVLPPDVRRPVAPGGLDLD